MLCELRHFLLTNDQDSHDLRTQFGHDNEFVVFVCDEMEMKWHGKTYLNAIDFDQSDLN